MKDLGMVLVSAETMAAIIICQDHQDQEVMLGLKVQLVLVVKRVSPDAMD